MKLFFIRHWFTLSIVTLILSFSLLNLYSSINSMMYTPFNEFDEAHRAENVKKMKEYKSYLIPITGSVQDRVIDLRIQSKDNPFQFLYFHLERPPLIYDLMILSTSIFGSDEFAYRLPSFILGMLCLFSFIFFVKYLSLKISGVAFVISFICLLTSGDLWLSSQYAQLDTGLTTFLFISLMSLIAYVEKKDTKFLLLAGFSFGLSILSKGQPAILLIPVIILLLVIRKLSKGELLKFILFAIMTILPWLIYVSWRFGFTEFIKIFSGFAFITVGSDITFHKAPFFWYGRWWWETLRPGWTLFLVLLSFDLIGRNFTLRKIILLVYILFNFAWLSATSNKLWWYVLPLIPPMCYYIYLVLEEYLQDKHKLINMGLVLIVASRPPMFGVSNTIAMMYGLFFAALSFFLLKVKISLNSIKLQRVFFIITIGFCLLSFYVRFPKIVPYHINIKTVSEYFSHLPGRKCLWIYEIPTESVLFYSDAGEVYTYNSEAHPFGHCQNFIITSSSLTNYQIVYQKGNMRLYQLPYK